MNTQCMCEFYVEVYSCMHGLACCTKGEPASGKCLREFFLLNAKKHVIQFI
jgi:hypothetical protein